jgi:hypothetical protein
MAFNKEFLALLSQSSGAFPDRHVVIHEPNWRAREPLFPSNLQHQVGGFSRVVAIALSLPNSSATAVHGIGLLRNLKMVYKELASMSLISILHKFISSP